ncbi:hypothetical protein DEO72_LG2g4142 [Vigna unguiculata]|uniref:Uncharacterized protein n=1 Tax=Vigna unguiculata TaxID=3917 RepID=A0A4D6L5S2_VIGUN|nr:hypothetical protein DEO72_LG2g4142 [Vigna unguiculata]
MCIRDRPTTEEGNLSGPIRTGHNQHTHTGNTRQPEPQLKGPSCSSAISSHNSRDAIPSHNSRNTTYIIRTQSCSSIDRLAGDTCRQALPTPRPPGGCRVPPGAQRPKNSPRCRYRLAVLTSPPGAQVPVTHCWTVIAWRYRLDRQALRHQVFSVSPSIAWRSSSFPPGAILEQLDSGLECLSTSESIPNSSSSLNPPN